MPRSGIEARVARFARFFQGESGDFSPTAVWLALAQQALHTLGHAGSGSTFSNPMVEDNTDVKVEGIASAIRHR